MRVLGLLSVLILTLLAGCATNPVTGQKDFVLMSESQEIALGRETHPQVLERYGYYDDPELQAYVSRIGERLAARSHRQDLVFRFTVVDSSEVNAFALPGGYVYVTRGILPYFNSEAELAAVLGHEIGHVTARHSVRQYTAAQVTGLAGAVIASQVGTPGASDVLNVLGTAVVRGYGRQHELEADRLGAEYLARTGYEPENMLDVLGFLKDQQQYARQMAEEEGRDYQGYSGLLATHPSNDRRLQELVRGARQYKPNGTSENREAFLEQIDGLVFGPGEDEGVLRGNRFYHAGLGIGLTFPEGWKPENRPDRLVATFGKQEALLQITASDLGKRMTPETYMREEMGLDDLRDGQSFAGPGYNGFTAIARAGTPFGTRDTRFAVILHADKAFILAGAAKAGDSPGRFDRAFLDTAKSFHQLSAAERELAKPRRIRVIRAKSGMTYESLGRQSPLAHHAADRLRLLNGDYPNGQPEAGQPIKIVE